MRSLFGRLFRGDQGRARGPMIAGAMLLAVLLGVGVTVPILAGSGGSPDLGGPIVVDPAEGVPSPSTTRKTPGGGGARPVEPPSPCAAGTHGTDGTGPGTRSPATGTGPAPSDADDSDDSDDRGETDDPGETGDRDCNDLDDVD